MAVTWEVIAGIAGVAALFFFGICFLIILGFSKDGGRDGK